MSDNLYRWREEVHQAVMEEPQCPSCRSTERNPSGSCQDCWHYWVPRNETKAMPKTMGIIYLTPLTNVRESKKAKRVKRA